MVRRGTLSGRSTSKAGAKIPSSSSKTPMVTGGTNISTTSGTAGRGGGAKTMAAHPGRGPMGGKPIKQTRKRGLASGGKTLTTTSIKRGRSALGKAMGLGG